MFEDGLDEDCIGDEKDREYLDNLNELEREQILADRQEKRRDIKFKQELL